jgi:tRNA uridine 5-carbamoylmethylation protein Kti12
MKAKFKYYPENQLLAEAFYGLIKLDDLHKINQQQAKQINLESVRKTFSDIRNANLVLSLNEINSYTKELKKLMQKMNFQWAIVTDQPQTTALSLLIKNDPFFDNRIRVYSTITAAFVFLGIESPPNSILRSDYFIVE